MTSTSLIGRQHDIDEVSNLLESPDVRLVTLTGPGGIGKTRLAIAVGEQLDEPIRARTVFVPLASITQPELVLPRVAAAVGATIEGTRPPLDVLIEHFAETPTLLVLDNLEQVVGVAPELDQLLSSCPDLKILATSRTVLRLRAEREYPVGALTVPAFSDQPPIEQLASLPAVQLFVDRAQAVRYDFALTEANALAVGGDLPAARWAAARHRAGGGSHPIARARGIARPAGERARRIGHRSGGSSPSVNARCARPSSGASACSTTRNERLLATLSVFADGWTVAAAMHVSGETEDRSPRPARCARRSQPRERRRDRQRAEVPHAHIRPRAGRRATRRQRGSADVEQRHAEYFGSLVESADWPAEQQADWAERLRTEEENLRVAIRWFFTHDITPLPHIFRVLWLFWQMRDRMPEGRAWIDELRLQGRSVGRSRQSRGVVHLGRHRRRGR